jgi:NAD(P)-dependent dehydrogenase (short-subunit alcohol dehydrogenase family)
MTASLFDLTGRIACVTGASSGIGRHLATALGRAGAKVVGVARRAENLQAWQAEAGGATAAVAADLSDPQAMQAIAGRIAAAFGPPDILITAAGINTRQTADDVTLAGWSLTLNVNLAAPFFLAQALVPAMKQRGWGRILNIASLQTARAMPGGVAYGASKAAIGQLTRAQAEAWSRYGINVNAIAPGFFETELTAPVFQNEALTARNAAQTCIGRNGRLDDLIGPALFFCSPASGYVTGQVLFVDGGFTAK